MLEESEKNAGSYDELPEDVESGTRSAGIVKQFALFGAASFLLATSLASAEEKSAWDLFKFANFLGCLFSDDPVFNSGAYSELRYATGCEIAATFHKDEFYYQNLFKKFANIVVCGGKLITREQNQHHQPDAWISVDGNDVPVEVKLGAFDEKAMKQLARYMSFYGCESGVAVGRTTDFGLFPENVYWVSLDTLDELEKQSPEYKKRILECNERTIRNLEAIEAFFKEILPPDALAIFERALNKDGDTESKERTP